MIHIPEIKCTVVTVFTVFTTDDTLFFDGGTLLYIHIKFRPPHVAPIQMIHCSLMVVPYYMYNVWTSTCGITTDDTLFYEGGTLLYS